MTRLFTGIELPQDVRDTLSGLHQPLPGARWIDDDDLHITLRFAGDIAPSEASEWVANLEAITFDPFTIRLTGLATFGGDSPRTIHATVEPSPELMKLAKAHEIAARRAGLAPVSRKFVPHITIIRLNYPRIEPIARFLSRRGGFVTEPFLVTHTTLFSARPNSGGGPYIVEETFPSTLGQFDATEWPAD